MFLNFFTFHNPMTTCHLWGVKAAVEFYLTSCQKFDPLFTPPFLLDLLPTAESQFPTTTESRLQEEVEDKETVFNNKTNEKQDAHHYRFLRFRFRTAFWSRG
jgi:hypothetical protein